MGAIATSAAPDSSAGVGTEAAKVEPSGGSVEAARVDSPVVVKCALDPVRGADRGMKSASGSRFCLVGDAEVIPPRPLRPPRPRRWDPPCRRLRPRACTMTLVDNLRGWY